MPSVQAFVSQLTQFKVEYTFSWEVGAILGLAFQGLDMTTASDKTRVWVAAFAATELDLWSKFGYLEDHEREAADSNRRVEHQIVVHNI